MPRVGDILYYPRKRTLQWVGNALTNAATKEFTQAMPKKLKGLVEDTGFSRVRSFGTSQGTCL
jgi:hypothetical protein